jgi:hypothetical protein
MPNKSKPKTQKNAKRPINQGGEYLGKQNSQIHSRGKGLTKYSAPGVTIVPDIYCVKLRYRQRLNIASTSGAFSYAQWSGNSLYDPYVTGGGSYPEGYTTLSALYTQYRVVASKIRVEFTTVGTTAPAQTFEIAITHEPNAVAPSSMEAMIASPYSKHYLNAGVTNPVPILENSMTTHKIFGVEPSAVLDDSRFTGAAGLSGTGGSPSNLSIWNVGVQSADRATTCNVLCYITLEFDCEFYERTVFTSMALSPLATISMDSKGETIGVASANMSPGETNGTNPRVGCACSSAVCSQRY